MTAKTMTETQARERAMHLATQWGGANYSEEAFQRAMRKVSDGYVITRDKKPGRPYFGRKSFRTA